MINAHRVRRHVIVIGASAGGFRAATQLLSTMASEHLPIVGLVLHRSPIFVSRLGSILTRATGVQVLEPSDGVPVLRNAVMLAPQDHHMLFENGRVRVQRGAKEHFTRPAIDPLFRSAAATYGDRVVGVILSGSGGDGADGSAAIKKAGGLSLVQSPSEAEFPMMPVRAIREDDIDGAFPIDVLGTVILALARGEAVPFMKPAPSVAGDPWSSP